MPGFIVSAKALLDTNQNPTRQDVRDWFQKHRNACRCTGYKPLVDAVMDAAKVVRGEMTADELAFKMPEDRRIWGSRYPRPSALAKVTGVTDYGADVGLKMPEGTLRLALVQAKTSHARIRSIDTSSAEKMPGVFKVITHNVETYREHGPFGAAGVGELPLTSSHVAVINAIANATGVRITRLPALPEKVLAGLEKLGS